MSAYNMGEKTCQEYGCVCWDCKYRNSHNRPKECIGGGCVCCDPDLPLDYYDEGDGRAGSDSYGGTSKCSCYQPDGVKRQYCSNCYYYAPDVGTCVNGDSEHCADFRELYDTCEHWKQKGE